jgi:GNAT superfamily N-acetyltransferase
MSSNHLEVNIRQYLESDWHAVLNICIAAFTPIHQGFERALGRELFLVVYPDWKASNESYLRSLCEKESNQILVAEIQNQVVGFIHYELNAETAVGRLGLNAVLPGWQGRGFGARLYERVLEILRCEGMRLVQVGTGGDEAHIAARRAYEKCGFSPIPVVHYFKKL